MAEHIFHELPVRSKIEMMQDVVQTIHSLHRGDRVKADFFIEDLKARSIQLDEEIQQSVLKFAEQVQFQVAYDPWHNITREVGQAADALLEFLK